MIRALRIDRDFPSKAEFKTLTAFLELLGFQSEVGKAGKSDTSATFSVPLGKVSLGWEESKELEQAVWSFAIEVDDPDSAFELVKKKRYEIVSDLSEYQTGWRHFIVQVTPDLRVAVIGAPEQWMAMKKPGVLHATGRRFAIVTARFNSFITDRLLHGALDGLLRLGAKHSDIEVVHVPGAFEIPSAARALAETKKYDAILCIGCLLRGDTAHYDVIANEVTRGIGQSAQETGVPHAFGVLTCDTLEQAIDRAGLKAGNKGFEAALAAVEMASLKRAISSQPSAVRKKSKPKRNTNARSSSRARKRAPKR